MDKYYKRAASEMSPPVVEAERLKQSRGDFNMSELLHDPGLRKKIEEYHPDLKDQIRREYLQREMAKEISNDSSSISTQDVANAFVRQYYLILHLIPEDTHKFYNDNSVMARSRSDSTMTVVSSMKDINDTIMSINYKECTTKIVIVHAQSSLNEAVLVGVKGHLTGMDKVTKTFTQTFLLALQSTGGYYVMNDFLFYIDLKETVRSPALSPDDVPENAATTPLAQNPEMAKEISNDSSSISAQDVANAFVKQYYLVLHLTPEDTHKFYKEGSVMARSGSDSKMTVVSTMKGINDTIMSIDYKECTSKIDIVHAQSSLNEAVLVGVKGHLTGMDKVTKTFTQTFLLAPQSTGGYYVMNDFLFYENYNNQARGSSAVGCNDGCNGDSYQRQGYHNGGERGLRRGDGN